MKKILAALLAVLMLVSLAACAPAATSSSAAGTSSAGTPSTGATSSAAGTSSTEEKLYYNKTGYPICDTAIALTAATGKPSTSVDRYSGKADATIIDQLDWYKTQLGLDITADVYDGESWASQITLMISTEELPDMLWSTPISQAEMNNYGKEGYFVDMKKYDELLPNFNAFCEEYPDLGAYVVNGDGTMYSVTKMNGAAYIFTASRFFLNLDWMENLNIETPQTLDDFYNMLVRFKNEDANGNGDTADEIPFSYTFDTGHSDRLLHAAFNIASTDSNMPIHVNDEGKVVLLDDNLKAYWRFLTKLYDEGLMDKNAFVSTADERKAQMLDNKIGAYGTGGAPFVIYGITQQEDHTVAKALASLASEYNGNKQQMYLKSAVQTNSAFVINANSEYIEACVRFMDYFYTEDGVISARYGPFDGERVIAAFDEALGIELVKVNDTDTSPMPSEFANAEHWRNSKLVLNEALPLTKADPPGAKYPSEYTYMQNNAAELVKDEEQWKKVEVTYGWAGLIAGDIGRKNTEMVNVYPTLLYGDDTDRRTVLVTDINTTMTEAKASMIIGGLDNFDAAWAKLEKDLEAMNVAELLAIEQKAYDAAK